MSGMYTYEIKNGTIVSPPRRKNTSDSASQWTTFPEDTEGQDSNSNDGSDDSQEENGPTMSGSEFFGDISSSQFVHPVDSSANKKKDDHRRKADGLLRGRGEEEEVTIVPNKEIYTAGERRALQKQQQELFQKNAAQSMVHLGFYV